MHPEQSCDSSGVADCNRSGYCIQVDVCILNRTVTVVVSQVVIDLAIAYKWMCVS